MLLPQQPELCQHLLCFCGGLTLAGCQTPTQPLSHSLSSAGGQAEENKMKKLLDWHEDREVEPLLIAAMGKTDSICGILI